MAEGCGKWLTSKLECVERAMWSCPQGGCDHLCGPAWVLFCAHIYRRRAGTRVCDFVIQQMVAERLNCVSRVGKVWKFSFDTDFMKYQRGWVTHARERNLLVPGLKRQESVLFMASRISETLLHDHDQHSPFPKLYTKHCGYGNGYRSHRIPHGRRWAVFFLLQVGWNCWW